MSRRNELNDETKPPPIWGWLQDRLYDTVFHVGDSPQEFLWSMAYGTDTDKAQAYNERQLRRQERRGEIPLTRKERVSFDQLLKRHDTEKLLDYWRRRKALLQHPNKHELITQYQKSQSEIEALKKQQATVYTQAQIKELEKQFRTIQSASSDRQSAKFGNRQR